MSRKLGRDLYLLINDNLVACAVNYTLTIGIEEIDINNPDSGVWLDSDPGAQDWSLTADYIHTYASFVEIFSLLRQEVPVTMQDRLEDTWILSGTGFIRNFRKSASLNGPATFNFGIKGKGELILSNPPVGLGEMVVGGLPAFEVD